MNNKILKISIVALIIVTFSGCCYSYSKTLNDEEYLNTVSNYIIGMQECTKHKGGSTLKGLFGDINESYLIPELDKQKLLLNGVKAFNKNIANLNIRNKDTKNNNKEIINKCNEVINLLEEDIQVKTDILNKDIDNYEKYKLVYSIDPDISKNIDKKFYDIDLILQNIKVENYSK